MTEVVSLAQLLKLGGLVALTFALLAGFYGMLADPQSILMRQWSRYCFMLERKLRSMFIFMPGWQIAVGQLVVVFLLLVALLGFGLDYRLWFVLTVIALAAPAIQIERMRRERVRKLDDQLTDFLQNLAGELKSTPSISNAFGSVQRLMPSPFKDEIELANKEMRVGSTLDQALLNMGGRIGSRRVDSALSAILIGRQLGGDLPQILELTAATLREMARLEGVVETKTAEGKAQLWVLAAAPFVMAFLLNLMSPGYFAPLERHVVGWLIAMAAGVFWLASLLVARKILQVDL